MKYVFSITLLFISQLTLATPIQLATVIMLSDSPSELQKAACVSDKTDYCNIHMCALPSAISESPDCQQICKKEAIKECAKSP